MKELQDKIISQREKVEIDLQEMKSICGIGDTNYTYFADALEQLEDKGRLALKQGKIYFS